MNRVVIGGLLFCMSMSFVSAQVQITEVMYDPSGTDTGREWVEVQNTSAGTIDFTTWKFFEANVNHGIDQIEGYAKDLNAGEFGVVVSDKAKFLADFPTFSGKIFKSSFSLSNSGENLAFKIESSGPLIDQYLYDVSLGAGGDGNSLQKGTLWLAALPTPGAATAVTSGGSSSGSGGTGITTATTTATTTPPADGGTTGGGTTTGTTTTTVILASTPVVSGSGGNYIVPQLFGAVIAPPVAIAGVDAILQGQAFMMGGKSVQNARFAWNFGDGSIGVGASTTHRYRYPGNYHIALDVTATINNNDTSVLEHATLTVIAPNVSISEDVDTDGVRYIRIENQTKYVLEVSSWIVERSNIGGEQYVLPKNTFISPYTSIRIPQDVTMFKNDNTLRLVELLFPNRTLAASYDPIIKDSPLVNHYVSVSSTSSNAIAANTPIIPKSVYTTSTSFKAQVPLGVSKQETLTDANTQEATSSSSTQDVFTAAIATSSSNGTSLLWYIVPLLVFVVGTGLFLGRTKEGDLFEHYTIIDDEK